MKSLILLSVLLLGFVTKADQSKAFVSDLRYTVGYSQMISPSNGQVNIFNPTVMGYPLNYFIDDSRTEELFCRVLGLYYVISDAGYTTDDINNTSDETKIDVASINSLSSFRLRKSNQFVERIVCQNTPYTSKK